MSDFRILSIDGGGTRGIIPATILHCLGESTGKHPVELFDLFAGTSTGAILCAGISYGLPTDWIRQLYLEKANEVFDDSWWDNLRDGFGKRIGADYTNRNLRKILQNQFGDATLGDIEEKNSGGKILMVATFHLHPQEGGKPVNFRAKVYNSHFRKDKDVKLVDLLLRSSAAPTYFPIYQEHIDGGVAINHPAMSAVAFAINNNTDPAGEFSYPDGRSKGLRKGVGELKVLSLSTGTSNRNYIPPKTIGRGDWGEIHWVKYLPDLLAEANVQVSEYYIRQVMPDNRYLRLDPHFDDPSAPPLIRNKIIHLDEKRKDILLAMQDFARDFYYKHENAILNFLGEVKKTSV